jgi:GTP cyclohydrolase I
MIAMKSAAFNGARVRASSLAAAPKKTSKPVKEPLMSPDHMEENAHFDEAPQAALRNLGIEPIVRDLLTRIGEDPDREGLLRTPTRVDKSMAFLTAGYTMNLDTIVNDALFTEEYLGVVVVKDIEFYSMCEHHMLPFFGVAHVAYIPNGKVIGLSKIPRIVEMFSRRLQLQERMTAQIADCLVDTLQPLGAAVITEARHLCMMMRGVEKQNSSTMTSAMRGEFLTNPQTRMELMSLVGPARR